MQNKSFSALVYKHNVRQTSMKYQVMAVACFFLIITLNFCSHLSQSFFIKIRINHQIGVENLERSNIFYIFLMFNMVASCSLMVFCGRTSAKAIQKTHIERLKRLIWDCYCQILNIRSIKDCDLCMWSIDTHICLCACVCFNKFIWRKFPFGCFLFGFYTC